jgi:hypothetical protein
VEAKGRGGRKGGAMIQTLYAHMNKRNFLKKVCTENFNIDLRKTKPKKV